MNNKKRSYKLIMFDMDGTILKGRAIFFFAEEIGFKDKLLKIFNSNREPYEKSIEIARFLKDIDSRELLRVFRGIPWQENVRDIARILNRKKITTVIVTDSYQFIADDLKERLDFNYAFANNLIIEQNIVTGEIRLNNNTLKRCDNGIIYSICKGQILEQLCDMLDISIEEVIAVGDGKVDIGMIKKAGLGIAYKAPEEVQRYADYVTDDLRVILDYI